jgi:hypothetical protein
MRIVITLLVRDEQEIIEDNLNYHFARGVDHAIVTDNCSSDSTPDILARYERQGRVTIINEPEDNYDQSRWVTRMARMAATDLEADWVIHADADEFFWPKSGDLEAALAGVPDDVGVLCVGRSNFLPVSGDGPFHQRMLVREAVSFSLFGDPIPPKICHRASPTVNVDQGNHGVTGVPGDTWPEGGDSPLFILHYPLRSYEQFERKIRLGGAAYERNTVLPWATGSGWRTRYDDYKAGRLPAWWATQVVEPEAIETGLGDGTLVRDLRLQAFFAEGTAAQPVMVDRVDPAERVSKEPPITITPAPTLPPRSFYRLAAATCRRLSREMNSWADRLSARSARRPLDRK